MSDWNTMTARERDAWIAENVFANKYPSDDWFYSWAQEPPHYTTDAAADYAVLVKVRETWDGCQRGEFSSALWESILKHRLMTTGWSEGDHTASWAISGIVAVVDFLKIGDYSHAAYLALTETP